MIKWDPTNNSTSWGESSATKWDDASADIAELLGKALDESLTMPGSVLYLEMWPDGGRFICYPAAPPNDDILADRVCAFVAQLYFQFWKEAWLKIDSNSIDAELIFDQLKRGAMDALIKGFEECGKHRPELGKAALYAFEFEGSEGIAMIRMDSGKASIR